MGLDRFVSITEATTVLGISRSTAYRLAKEGKFPVPVHIIGDKHVVSLRRLVEYINSDTAEAS